MRQPQSLPADRPFVLVNMAMTADGKIATANRRVSSFGSAADEENLYRLRATADAVMNGARTADLNPIDMGPGPEKWRRARRRRGLAEQNLRVIVSGSGTLDVGARVFREGSPAPIVITTETAPHTRLVELRAVAAAVLSVGRGEVDWPAALRWLRERWNVRRLLCEGGGALNDALFRAGVVDELHLTICPVLVGGRAAPTIADGPGFARLADAYPLRLSRRRRVGRELFLTFTRSDAG